ncbi:NINE protein [Geodermatophilus sp. SYSU D00703]
MTYPPQPGPGEPLAPQQDRPAPQPQAWGQQGPYAPPVTGWASPAFPPQPISPQPVPAQPPYAQVPGQPYGAAPYPVLPKPYKDSTAAWLLWFFLGAFGAHHFYLGRTQWGVLYAVGFVVSWLLAVVIIGFLGLIALFVLWIIDAAQMSRRLQEYNAHAYAVNRSLGLA